MADIYNAGVGGPMDRALRRMRGEVVPEPPRRPDTPASRVEEARQRALVRASDVDATTSPYADNSLEIDALIAAARADTLAKVKEYVQRESYDDGRGSCIGEHELLAALDAMEGK